MTTLHAHAAPRRPGTLLPRPGCAPVDDDALRSPCRQALVELARDSPGAPVPAAIRACGLGRTTVLYHLRRLERAGILQVRKQGGRLRVYPRGLTPAEDPASAAIGASRARRAIFDLVARSGGGFPRGRLRDAFPSMPERTRNHALRALLASGVLGESEGRLVARVGGVWMTPAAAPRLGAQAGSPA